MVILLTGATGFIGQRLASALSAAGHTFIAGRRDDRGSQAVAIDFTRDLDLTAWLPRLTGIDAVINAVGVLRERGPHTFERIHTLAPQALFDACVVASVRRVVQISALGADHGTTRYFSSKRAADEHLARLPLDWTIIQPALVFGPGGTSARLFTLLGSLPVIHCREPDGSSCNRYILMISRRCHHLRRIGSAWCSSARSHPQSAGC